MTTPDKCPFCNAELRTCQSSQQYWHYTCERWYNNGSQDPESRTKLCIERQARQKAEAELQSARQKLNDYGKGIRRQEYQILKCDEENQKLRELLEEAIDLIDERWHEAKKDITKKLKSLTK